MIQNFTPDRFEYQRDDVVYEGDQEKCPVERICVVIGVILLVVSMFAEIGLVLAHLDAVALPGCGAASDCARAGDSVWGKLPGTEWPLSFLGFAYFQALLAAFIYGGGRLPIWLRSIVGAGAAVSALLIVVMFREGYLCGYCLAIHALNISFTIGSEQSRWLAPGRELPSIERVGPLVVFIGTFLATSLLLAVVQQQSTTAAAQRTESQLKQALHDGVRASSGAHSDSGYAPGRYYLGSKTAKVHVVVVSDYQCPSCRMIDAQLRATADGRDDISISARHFPFCTDCNKHVDKTRHQGF